jgi:hypothetical protein
MKAVAPARAACLTTDEPSCLGITMICCLFYPDNDSDANMLLDTPGNYFFATKKTIHHPVI